MGHYSSGIITIGYGTYLSIRDLAWLVSAAVGYQRGIRWDTTKPDGTPRKLMKSTGYTLWAGNRRFVWRRESSRPIRIFWRAMGRERLGLECTLVTVHNTLGECGADIKKTLQSSEQDREDAAQARIQWAERQSKLNPEKLVFIDESSAKINIVRPAPACPRPGRPLEHHHHDFLCPPGWHHPVHDHQGGDGHGGLPDVRPGDSPPHHPCVPAMWRSWTTCGPVKARPPSP